MQHLSIALMWLSTPALALAAPDQAPSDPGDAVLAAPTLSIEGADEAAGYLTLSWSGAPEGSQYQVEAATDAAFSDAIVRYEGAQTATVRSGLTDGAYHYRVRARRTPQAAWGAWSEPLVFQVAHHSLSLALGLFGLGAVVFVGTLLFLVGASREVETRG